MGYFISADGAYHEGDEQPGDTPCPQRPAFGYLLEDGAWVPGPPVVPQNVTMRQARITLLRAGLLDKVTAAIAALPSPSGDEARITWEFASEIQRDGPLIGQLAPGLGLTEKQIDALFIEADTL